MLKLMGVYNIPSTLAFKNALQLLLWLSALAHKYLVAPVPSGTEVVWAEDSGGSLPVHSLCPGVGRTQPPALYRFHPEAACVSAVLRFHPEPFYMAPVVYVHASFRCEVRSCRLVPGFSI